MGYATTTEIITADAAERLRTEKTAQRSFGYGHVDSFASRLLRAAVSNWRQNEAGRFEDARSYGAELHQPVAKEVRGRGVDWDAMSVEDAHIIPIAASESVTTVTKKMKLTVPGELADKLRSKNSWGAQHQVRELLEKQIPTRTLGTVEVLSVPSPRKPQAKATEGKAVTRYVITATENIVSALPAVRAALKGKYDTQAEARSVALALLTEHDTLPALQVEAVVGRVTEDGTFSKALVTVARPTAPEAVITVNVTTHTVKVNPKIDSYEVTFWYHH